MSTIEKITIIKKSFVKVECVCKSQYIRFRCKTTQNFEFCPFWIHTGCVCELECLCVCICNRFQFVFRFGCGWFRWAVLVVYSKWRLNERMNTYCSNHSFTHSFEQIVTKTISFFFLKECARFELTSKERPFSQAVGLSICLSFTKWVWQMTSNLNILNSMATDDHNDNQREIQTIGQTDINKPLSFRLSSA